MINRVKEIIRWWLDVYSVTEEKTYREDVLSLLACEYERRLATLEGSEPFENFKAEIRGKTMSLSQDLRNLQQWLPIRVAQHGGFYKMRVMPVLNDYKFTISWVFENTETEVYKSSYWKTASEAEKAGYCHMEKLEDELKALKGKIQCLPIN